MTKKWIKISSHPNYRVSTDGEIMSIRTGKHLKFDIGKKNYCRVTLCIGGETERFLVHRIVAKHFLPNPEGKRTVNHKDGDPTNNQLSNLEWATHSENHLHAFKELGKKPNLTMLGKRNTSNSKPVAQYSKTDVLLKVHPSINEAFRSTKIEPKNISAVCLGKLKSCGGYKWRFADGI